MQYKMGESAGRGARRGAALTEGYNETDLRIAAYLAAGLTQEATGDAVGLSRISIQNHLKANPWIKHARDIIRAAVQRKITEISVENEEDYKRQLGQLRKEVLAVYKKGLDSDNLHLALNAAAKVDNRLHGAPTQRIEGNATVKHEIYQIPAATLQALMGSVEKTYGLLGGEVDGVIDVDPLEDDESFVTDPE